MWLGTPITIPQTDLTSGISLIQIFLLQQFELCMKPNKSLAAENREARKGGVFTFQGLELMCLLRADYSASHNTQQYNIHIMKYKCYFY